MSLPATTPARELTPQEAEQRAEVAFALDQRVKEGLKQGRMALWHTAEALYEFDEAHAWSALGFEGLQDWLADPEVSIGTRTYYRLVRTWRQLVVHRHVALPALARLDASKVDIVLPAIEASRVGVDEALADVESMGARDLREKYVHQATPEPGPPEADPDPDGVTIVLDDEPVLASDVHNGAGVLTPDDRLVAPDDEALEQGWVAVAEALASNSPYPRVQREVLLNLYAGYGPGLDDDEL